MIYPDMDIPDITIASSVTGTYGRELAFDFTSGQFIKENGKPIVVKGIQALQIWIEKTIRTARYRFPAYTFQYGCELDDIIGMDIPKAVLEAEIPRVIKEALIYDSRIEDLRNFVIERDEDWLKVTFTVITALGDIYQQGVSV